MNNDEYLKQLDEAIQLCERFAHTPDNNLYCSSRSIGVSNAVTTALTLAERISGRTSVYYEQIDTAIKSNGLTSWYAVPPTLGVLKSLRRDVEQGLLTTIRTEIQSELFSDFLERAASLLDEGHKDAAAVIAGSVLEEHLRQLCISNDMELDLELEGGLKPKKADRLNAELAKAEVYSKLDLKSITAWLDLRNKAAHGKYQEYQSEQVSLMISGIRDFVRRLTL